MQRVDCGDLRGAWQVYVRTSHKHVITSVELGRASHHHLRYYLSVASGYGCVITVHHMEHHRVVCRIGVMVMAVPVACTYMHLYIPRPSAFPYLNFSVKEIGTGICVVPSRIDYGYSASVHSDHIGRGQQPILPHIVHQTLHSCNIMVCCKLGLQVCGAGGVRSPYTERLKATIFMAVSAASEPLLPSLPPARSRACCSSSTVSTPNITGMSHSAFRWVMPWVTLEHT